MTVLVSVTVVVGPSSVVVAVSVSVEVGPFTVTVTVSVVVEPPSVTVTNVQTVFVLVRVTVFVFVFQSVLVTVFACPPNANAAAVVAVAVEHAGSGWPRSDRGSRGTAAQLREGHHEEAHEDERGRRECVSGDSAAGDGDPIAGQDFPHGGHP